LMVSSATASSPDCCGEASKNESIAQGGPCATTESRHARAPPTPLLATPCIRPARPPAALAPADLRAPRAAASVSAAALAADAARPTVEDHPGLWLWDARRLGSLLARPGQRRRPGARGRGARRGGRDDLGLDRQKRYADPRSRRRLLHHVHPHGERR